MNKKEWIRERAKRYFYQQKFEEIFSLIMWICYIVLIPYSIGSIGVIEGSIRNDLLIAMLNWFVGITYLICLMMSICLVLYIKNEIKKLFRPWIEKNWKRAYTRAKEDYHLKNYKEVKRK